MVERRAAAADATGTGTEGAEDAGEGAGAGAEAAARGAGGRSGGRTGGGGGGREAQDGTAGRRKTAAEGGNIEMIEQMAGAGARQVRQCDASGAARRRNIGDGKATVGRT